MDHLKSSRPTGLMKIPKLFHLALIVCLFAASCTPAKPSVTLNPTRVLHSGHVAMKGTGFTKNSEVISHLKRPDGTQFPTLPMMSDANGEITHDIDTLLLSPGTHEVWVEDPASKMTSEIVRFEVTNEQK